MSQQVQELIDKIKSEGIEAADQKADEIEAQAKKKAEEIIANAKKEADDLIKNAKAEAQKSEESARMALKQASRDTLLALRKEIGAALKKILTQEVKDSLSSDDLAGILGELIKGTLSGKSKEGIEVSVSKKDLDALNKSFIAKLQKQIKEPITFKSSGDIAKGFTISFDAGKSSFDFTDEALAEHLSTYLNEKISAILKESA